LAVGLEKNSSLTWLHLSGNTLGDDGMVAILKAIRVNPMSQLVHLEASRMFSILSNLVNIIIFFLFPNEEVDIRGEAYAHLALLYKEHREQHKKSPTQVDLSFNPLGAEISSMKRTSSPFNVNWHLLYLYPPKPTHLRAIHLSRDSLSRARLSSNGLRPWRDPQELCRAEFSRT